MAQMKPEILWSGGFVHSSLDERVAAAARLGYRAVSALTQDFDALGRDAGRAREAARRAADLGVRLEVFDVVTDWYAPDGLISAGMPQVSTDTAFAAAEAFGCTMITALPAFPSRLPIEGVAEAYARLCDEAWGRGVSIQLEFRTVPPVCGLADGWDVVRLADRPNGMLVFDAWHCFKSGSDLALLDEIPGDRISAVQIDDGLMATVESLRMDSQRYRRLPGEGEFPLKAALRALRRIGGLNGLGPEVISLEQDALPIDEAADRVDAALRRLLADLEDGPEA
jgi:sugar phosphate isomerase/epimerase